MAASNGEGDIINMVRLKDVPAYKKLWARISGKKYVPTDEDYAYQVAKGIQEAGYNLEKTPPGNAFSRNLGRLNKGFVDMFNHPAGFIVGSYKLPSAFKSPLIHYADPTFVKNARYMVNPSNINEGSISAEDYLVTQDKYGFP